MPAKSILEARACSRRVLYRKGRLVRKVKGLHSLRYRSGPVRERVSQGQVLNRRSSVCLLRYVLVGYFMGVRDG